MDIFEWEETIPVTANNLNEMQNIINDNISESIESISSSIPVVSTNYVKIGNIGICWGQTQPTYNNANVMQSAVSLPLSFINGRAIATTVNYANIGAELDAIAKVPSAINGTSMALALHSNSGKFTSESTSFYINYIVIGQVS